MHVVCGQCGEAMIPGRVTPTGVESDGDPRLSFVVSAGTPTSWNPIKAVLQGMHGDPAFREEVCPIRSRVCPRCGRVELFLDMEDLSRVTGLAQPGATE